MNRNAMAIRVARRHLTAVHRMRLYHGTELKNLPSIEKKGLIAQGGVKWSATGILKSKQDAVYLTSDIELAARYAVGHAKQHTPAVLEVDLTSSRRFKKVRYDPLDRQADAWNYEEHYDDSVDFLWRELDKAFKQTIRDMGADPGYHNLNWSYDNELEGFDGEDAYKRIANDITKLFGKRGDTRFRRQVMKALQRNLPDTDFGYMEIKGGVLKLTEEYFETREQLMYLANLPPAAIKGVWVRISDFKFHPSEYLELRKFDIKKLPGEAADETEALREAGGKIINYGPEALDSYEVQTAIEILDAMGDPFANEIRDLQKVDYEDLDPDELEDFKEEVENLGYGLEEGANDDWGQEIYLDQDVRWGKLSLKETARLAR